MINNNFEVLDLFLVRIPLLPIEYYIQNFEVENLDRKINEAIFVASINLGKKLLFEKKTYDDEMVDSSRLKYSIRMSTRATPFGVFSAVSYGRFGASTNISFDGEEDRKKKTRPDMSWLFQIIKELELNENVNRLLSYTLNPSIYSIGDRAFLIDQSFLRKGKSNNEIISVKKSIVMETIEENYKGTMVSYNTIVNKLRERFQANQAQIDGYLQQLIENEYLISNLRPTLNNSSPFECFINELPEIPIREKITEIQKLLSDFDKHTIGYAGHLLSDIIDKMEEIVGNGSPLQVDTYLEPKNFILTNSIKNQIIKAVNCLWIMNQFENDRLIDYKKRFINKYGIDTEIELMELIDEDIGLGLPEYLKHRINEKAKSQMETLIIDACLNRKTEIVITEEVLNNFSFNEAKLPTSTELYASLLFNNKSVDHKDKTILIVSSIQPSISAGSSLGRFTHLLDKGVTKTYYDELTERICSLKGDPMVAVISSYPIVPRHANVMINEIENEYEIPITVFSNNKEQIHLDDILVGISNQMFYLKHKTTGRLIHLMHQHLLIPEYQSPISKFLHELSLAGQSKMSGLYHRTALPFKPRIRYQDNIILSVASWKISPEWESDLYSNIDSIDVFMQKFIVYREKWKVPRYVFLCDFDNRLLLDLNKLFHVKEIHKMILQKKTLVLEELIGELSDHAISGTSGSYLHEFVFSLVSNQQDIITQSESNNIEYSSHYDRYFTPFSEWTTLKIFGLEKRKREFLTKHLYPYFEGLSKDGYIKKWFFLQYIDEEGKHIRIRYKTDNENQILIHSRLIEWVRELRSKRMISTINFAGYEQELWRYGGKETIDLVENFFQGDSTCAIAILKNNNSELDLYAILSLSTMLILLTNEQMKINDISKEYNSDYRLIKKRIEQLMKTYYFEKQYDDVILECIKQRNEKLKPILNRRERLTQEQWMKLSSSLVHMHCNRLFGIDPEKERKVTNISRHVVLSSKYYL